jgi:hypothetical protein
MFNFPTAGQILFLIIAIAAIGYGVGRGCEAGVEWVRERVRVELRP